MRYVWREGFMFQCLSWPSSSEHNPQPCPVRRSLLVVVLTRHHRHQNVLCIIQTTNNKLQTTNNKPNYKLERTSLNSSVRSRNFWFDNALIGDV